MLWASRIPLCPWSRETRGAVHGHRSGRKQSDHRVSGPHRAVRREGGARAGGTRAHQGVPRHAGGEARGPRDHVRHQHGHRRVLGEDPHRRSGQGLPALSRLQPRGGDRRSPAPIEHVRGAHGGPRQRARARQLGLPAGDHAHVHRDAQQGRDARRVPERVRGRVRRPGADGPARAPVHGRRGGVLSGRAAPGRRGHEAGGDRGARPAGARRAGSDQRLEPADGDVRAAHLRYGAVAQAGGDRGGDVHRGAAWQPEAVQRDAARVARLLRRDRVGQEHHEGPGRIRPRDGQDEDEGAGRVLDALDPAGDRRGARRHRVRARAGRDRAQRRRRQPDLRPRAAADADRRELPGIAGGAADGHGGRGHHDGVRAVGAAAEPADQPRAVAGAARLPGARAGLLLGPDAQPVHRRPSHRRAAHAVGAGVASSPSRRRPTRRTSCRWA